MNNPTDTLASIFGGKGRLAALVEVVPSAVSNWRRSGIPNHQKWLIRQLLERSQISAAERARGMAALEQPWPPEPGERLASRELATAER